MLRNEFTLKKDKETKFITFTHRIKDEWYQFSMNSGYLELIDMNTQDNEVNDKLIKELENNILENKYFKTL